jgi:hypothetical protein
VRAPRFGSEFEDFAGRASLSPPAAAMTTGSAPSVRELGASLQGGSRTVVCHAVAQARQRKARVKQVRRGTREFQTAPEVRAQAWRG